MRVVGLIHFFAFYTFLHTIHPLSVKKDDSHVLRFHHPLELKFDQRVEWSINGEQ